MTMIVTITGDKVISRKIAKIQTKLKAPKAMLTRIGKNLVKYFQENMESEGVKLTKKRWKELKPETAAAKARLGFGGKKILERTGKLKAGIKTMSVTKDTLKVGNPVDYYPYHQLGGRKLPKRQMLGVNTDVGKIVMDEVKKEISFA